jgi:hypothetical protein
MRLTAWVSAAVLLVASGVLNPVTAGMLPTVADAELRENTNANSGNNGTSINARYNNLDRNEWIALKFDLSSIADKSLVSDVSLNTVMFRSNSNNTKNLGLYALTPGTTGEDWDETTVSYDDMPGFTFDTDSTTNVLDVGGAVTDLGAFEVSGVETKGDVAVIDPASLTTLVQNMGSNNLLTILISTASATNGQWRIASKEATALDGGSPTGNAGDFAAILEVNVVPEPTAASLAWLACVVLVAARRRRF